MSILKYVIDDINDNKKLRDYLKSSAGLSTRLLRGAAMDGRIKVNSKTAKLNYVLKLKDIVEVDVSKKESQNIVPEKMELDIIYEDEDIIVVNKPPFMVVHPTKTHGEHTLASGVLYHFKENGEDCIVRLVSRLDMDTSGLIVIAKNQYSHMFLAKEMEKNTFEKQYTAVVWGNLSQDSDTIDLPILRPSLESIKRVVREDGQRSITHYQVMEHLAKGDIVRLKLETGRTHQIRVHLSHLGHPIVGDILYGSEDDRELIARQALHASGLKFMHPRKNEVMEFQSPLPEDMSKLIERLK
ncbi:RluA family pseudouridine synthase [Clostridium oryzae]|uniref:Pseudouridine synthase n=1 Tax=Clostridium oryzae TaxID=1450648 RepID=A0A1V4IVG5_9CLOT|nr:RluA family pseudouridine synthase [Clostridium oryzae]OPJ63775.1 ribosomal large subunit pseudouridine synthase D [Clostridium oryzae]